MKMDLKGTKTELLIEMVLLFKYYTGEVINWAMSNSNVNIKFIFQRLYCSFFFYSLRFEIYEDFCC